MWFCMSLYLKIKFYINFFFFFNVGTFPPFELLGWELFQVRTSGWELYQVGTLPGGNFSVHPVIYITGCGYIYNWWQTYKTGYISTEPAS